MDRATLVACISEALSGNTEAMEQLQEKDSGLSLDEVQESHSTLFFAGDKATSLSVAAHLGRDPMAMAGELINLYDHFGYHTAPEGRQPADWLPYLLALWAELETLAPENPNGRELAQRYLHPTLTKLTAARAFQNTHAGDHFWKDILQQADNTIAG